MKLNYTALDPTQEKLHCSSLSYYKFTRHFKKGSLFFHIYKKSFCVFLLCLVPVFTFTTLMALFCQAIPFSTPYELDSFSYPLLPTPSSQLSTTATLSTYQRSYERDTLPYWLLPTSSSQSSTTATLSATSSSQSSTTATSSAHQGFQELDNLPYPLFPLNLSDHNLICSSLMNCTFISSHQLCLLNLSNATSSTP